MQPIQNSPFDIRLYPTSNWRYRKIFFVCLEPTERFNFILKLSVKLFGERFNTIFKENDGNNMNPDLDSETEAIFIFLWVASDKCRLNKFQNIIVEIPFYFFFKKNKLNSIRYF